MLRLRLPASSTLAILLMGAILLSGCGPAPQPAPAVPSSPGAQPVPPTTMPTTAATEIPAADMTGTLNVLDWAGYDQADFWVDFKDKYPKASVNFEIGASDADIFSKMKAGDQSDIFHPSIRKELNGTTPITPSRWMIPWMISSVKKRL